MKSRDFCYWLQGYFEIKDGEETVPSNKSLTHHQVCIIKNHLSMVFEHEIDPSHGTKEHQEALSQIHAGLGGAKINC